VTVSKSRVLNVGISGWHDTNIWFQLLVNAPMTIQLSCAIINASKAKATTLLEQKWILN